MVERHIDQELLKIKALEVVKSLKGVAERHERTFPSVIQAVLVFSGPGTYYQKLKENQASWMRWMDRDRIRAGVAVVREVAAARISEGFGQKIKGHYIEKEDILKYGPFLVYNGIPLENEIFLKALDSAACKLPKEKVVVIDTVQEADGSTHPVRHTGDQVKSFYQSVRNPQSPLYDIENVALVAHIPDHVRIPFYTKLYNDQHIETGGRSIQFWAYGLRSRHRTEQPHLESELPRLITYAERGHLATEPSPFGV